MKYNPYLDCSVYAPQTSEPVSLLPKTLRTFKQFLYQMGKEDFSYNHFKGAFVSHDFDWLTPSERCAYRAGWADAMVGDDDLKRFI
jgi:hypothetical protein